jgi:hypothetical protein
VEKPVENSLGEAAWQDQKGDFATSSGTLLKGELEQLTGRFCILLGQFSL